MHFASLAKTTDWVFSQLLFEGWGFGLDPHGLDQRMGSMRTKPFSFVA
jgi:hypothetical protein